MARRRKKPEHKPSIHALKRAHSLPTLRDGQITFSFSIFDGDTHWCDGYDAKSHFHTVAKKLRQYQSMTWNEILSRDHPVEVTHPRFTERARRRLGELRLEEFDSIWRLALNGKPRLWGIRYRDVFYVLWWDPEHQVCPSAGADN